MRMLPDARILLTGATGGIGGAIAERLVANGAAILLHGRDALELQKLKSRLGNHAMVSTVSADLTQADGQAAVVQAARNFHGGVNKIIHNAGWNQFGWFEDQPDSVLTQTLQINLQAPMLLTHALLPLLHRQRAAHLLFITSTFGRIGYPGYTCYSAAKFGLTGFAESLRRELADSDIAVTTLSPRATRTTLNTANVIAMNRALHVRMDPPECVAIAVLEALEKRPARRQLGWPEKLFVRINALFPRIIDRALAKQLPLVKRFAFHKGGHEHEMA